jgi:hypothetical protein
MILVGRGVLVYHGLWDRIDILMIYLHTIDTLIE